MPYICCFLINGRIYCFKLNRMRLLKSDCKVLIIFSIPFRNRNLGPNSIFAFRFLEFSLFFKRKFQWVFSVCIRTSRIYNSHLISVCSSAGKLECSVFSSCFMSFMVIAPYRILMRRFYRHLTGIEFICILVIYTVIIFINKYLSGNHTCLKFCLNMRQRHMTTV